ncbi:TRAM domain-containing protein [Halovivax cerinus]|uniref:TRAM domain-containing protein n=1 Tax=Halovivax cerinus TaxID=1487865 RepID=A0ABD5NNY3_9EURY|nr:TRAM domain-containing protein [Halovivax cerinus]
MIEIDDSLRTVFTGRIERRDDAYVVEVPRSEVDHRSVTAGETYRVALIESTNASSGPPDGIADRRETPSRPTSRPEPPVTEGEEREVTIEAIGEQGDGIAKVERGYVVIVEGATPGDTPTVRIDDVTQNVAFASVVDADRAIR